jgi:hypothetical protein
MSYSNSKDESLLTYYDNVRQQVDAERYLERRFTTGSVKQYANSLREEMDRRRLKYRPINWP